MSRRARTRLLARELKRADAYLSPEPEEDDDTEDDGEGNTPDAWAFQDEHAAILADQRDIERSYP